MPMSDYLLQVRAKVGNDLLVLPSAAVALFDAQSRLLLGRHSDHNIWVMPGGLVEPGELPADAAVREVWEETGVHVELTSLLGVFGGPDLVIDYANGDKASYVATIFRGGIRSGVPKADGAEILEVRYFSFDEMLHAPVSKWMRSALPLIFAPSGNACFQPPSWHP